MPPRLPPSVAGPAQRAAAPPAPSPWPLPTPNLAPQRRDAAAAGCTVVTGGTMFVGQAADQFKLFTGHEAPVALMSRVVLESLGH